MSVDRLERDICDRVETLRRAYLNAGVRLLPEDERYLRNLAGWGHYVPEQHLYRDERSAAVVERLAETAAALRTAIGDALDMFDVDMPAGTKINLAEYLTENPSSLRDMALSCSAIEMAAEQALTVGQLPGRGRPPNRAYAAFVEELHALYRARTGRDDVYKDKDSRPAGRFVALVVEAQEILPVALRLSEASTIGNRVLAAAGRNRPAA